MAELVELHLIVVWFCDSVAQICPKYVHPNIFDVGYSVADSKSHRGSSASLLGVALSWFSKCSYLAPCARGLQTCLINARTGSGRSLFVSPSDRFETQKTRGRNKCETHRCPKSFGVHIMRREVSAHSEVASKAPSNAMDQQ